MFSGSSAHTQPTSCSQSASGRQSGCAVQRHRNMASSVRPSAREPTLLVTALVGVDVGTTGARRLAISPTGEVLAKAEEGHPLSTPRPGWSEQHPEDWWRATERALGSTGPARLAGIGLSGQMHGLVCLDAAEEVLRPAILWNDQRTAAECAEIEERWGGGR